jgi:hypothetical protein
MNHLLLLAPSVAACVCMMATRTALIVEFGEAFFLSLDPKYSSCRI